MPLIRSVKIGIRIFFLLTVLGPSPAVAYGISGHLRAVYENWNAAIAGPTGSKAEGYAEVVAASAGALISDIGYALSPFKQFSNAVHYLHSADIARDAMEYAKELGGKDQALRQAFAAGLGTHYWADRYGHYESTNRLVALLALSPGAPPRSVRVTYENNEWMHTWIEARAVAFDLKYGSDQFEKKVEQYIVGVTEYQWLAADLSSFLQQVLNKKYGDLNVRIDPVELVRYLRFSAKLLCAGLDAESKDKSLQSRFSRVLGRCAQLNKFLTGKKSPDSPDMRELVEYVAKPLSSDPARENEYAAIYNASHAMLSSHFRKHGTSSHGQAWNLDTNLPSAAGTYRTADLTVEQLSRGRAGRLFPDYLKSGVILRERFATPIQSSAQSRHMIAEAETDALVGSWLTDIVPDFARLKGMKVSIQTECHGPGTTLSLPDAPSTPPKFMVTAGVVCAKKGSRLIDLLYALGMADELENAGAKPEGGWGAAYLEALDRLRLSDREIARKNPEGMYTRSKP